MQEGKSKISNTEWGLVISALLVIDLCQILIEWLLGWLGAGVVINWIIDILVGMSFALYLQLRGEKMTDPKRAFGLIGTFLLELIPVVDEFPLWCLDGIYVMTLAKRRSIIKTLSPTGKTGVVSNTNNSNEEMDKAA